MKKKYIQKMLTMVLTAAMICSSVPVAAETVSENETAVTVDTAEQETAEEPEMEADEEAQPKEAGETVEEADAADIEADMVETEDTEVENGKEGYLSYHIYQKPDGTQYVEITDCDASAKEAIEIPKEIKGIAVTSIGSKAFYWCSGLTSIEIPAGVTSIGEYAFSGCSRLTSIKIPAGVTSIGDSAFSGCSGLTSIEIPAGVTSIGDSAFRSCSGLTSIVVEAGNTVYDSRGDCNAIIEKETNTLIQGCKKTKIPAGVTSIGDSVFEGCSGLTSIEIPAGVTSIGEYAFSGCSGLTRIEIPAGVTSIGDSVFEGCSGLTRIEIPAEVTSIGDSAFSGCSGLTRIEIPAGVTSIGWYAFEGCSGLTSIEIPAGVTEIGYAAFSGCSGLKDVYYTGTQEQWDNIWGSGSDASDVFYYYDEDLGEDISIPFTLHCNSSRPEPSQQPSAKPSAAPSVQPSAAPSATPSAAPSTSPSQQPGSTPSAVPSKTPEANVPAAGTKLKEKTGREYKVTKSDSSKGKPSVTITKLSAKDKKAKKVTIPKTITVDNVEYQVTGIAAKAFKNSKKLQSIVIPDTITEIGAGSFEGCKNLKSVTIGKGVTSIGKNAFKNCKNLKKITVKSTKLKKVGKGALTGINRKCVIKVPKKKLKSYKSLFKGKGQKKSVKIKK